MSNRDAAADLPTHADTLEVRRAGAEHVASLETLFENAPVGFAFVDRELRYVQVNPALAAIHGTAAGHDLGRPIREVVPQLWRALEPLLKRALAGETILNQDVSGVTSARKGELRHWLVNYYPVLVQSEVVGVGIVVNDITERRQAEEALRIRSDLYAMLLGVNRAVSRCRTVEELFREACAIAVETGRFRFAWVGALDGGRVLMTASAGNGNGYVDDVGITLNDDPRSNGPTGQAFRTGKPFVVNDFNASPATARRHAGARRAGFAASAAFPFKERGSVVAVLTLYAAAPGFFTDDLVATLGEFTPGVSFALDAFVQERDEREAVTALRRSEQRFRRLAETLPIGLWEGNGSGEVVYANPALTRLVSAAQGDASFLLGQGWRKIFHPEDLATFSSRGLMVPEISLEMRMVPALTGRTHAILTRAAVLDEHGTTISAVGTLMDISDRVAMEDALREGERKYRTLFENAQVGMFRVAAESGEILEANDRFARIFGYLSAAELPATVLEIAGSLLEAVVLQSLLGQSGDGRELDGLDIKFLRRDGQERWLRLSCTREGEDGTAIDGVAVDITEEREARAALGRLNQELEQRVQERTGQLQAAVADLEAFSYSVSHDLRAPLRAIDGFSNVLAREFSEQLGESGTALLERVRQGSTRMALLIDSLLRLARLSRAPVSRAPLDLSDLARRAAREAIETAGAEGVELLVKVDLREDADAELVRVLLQNLFENAVKFTRHMARPVIEFGARDDGAYFVSDNGVGFDEAYADRMFQPFQRLHAQEEFEGTGIGLATVERIVRRHGGRVWAEGARGRGATISFTLRSEE